MTHSIRPFAVHPEKCQDTQQGSVQKLVTVGLSIYPPGRHCMTEQQKENCHGRVLCIDPASGLARAATGIAIHIRRETVGPHAWNMLR